MGVLKNKALSTRKITAKLRLLDLRRRERRHVDEWMKQKREEPIRSLSTAQRRRDDRSHPNNAPQP
jgi:hypothetical protein